MRNPDPAFLLPPEVSGTCHRLRAATVLPVLDQRRTAHLVIWEAVGTETPGPTPAQRVFVCAYEASGGAPFMAAEISPGVEATELTSTHDSGAFAIGLKRDSGEWSIRKLSV